LIRFILKNYIIIIISNIFKILLFNIILVLENKIGKK